MVSGVGVVDKVIAVLDALEVEPCSLADLVAGTGLPRATAHRLAVALETHGLVRRDAEGRFVLGLRMVSFGRVAAGAFPWSVAARPVLERLRDETGESVQLYVRDGDVRVCIEALESPNELRTIVPVGARLTLTAGSAGKLLSGDPAALQRGWAESVAERAPGVASVSAPVHDASERVIAAISVSGPIDRTSTKPGKKYAPAVRRAAADIESRLAAMATAPVAD